MSTIHAKFLKLELKMSDYPSASANILSTNLRLQTLIRLRWLTMCGQAVTVLLVYFGFNSQIPVVLCLMTVALLAFINIYLKIRYREKSRILEKCAAWQLGGDILQLTLLLYFTGGLSNPFSILFLAPVMISASAMSAKWTVFLVILAILSTSALLVFEPWKLPWANGGLILPPYYYMVSTWVALVFSLIFMAMYGFRVARESRQLAEALKATDMVVAREQHLHALDGLAAAAAHELGTPLATIHLAAKELESELDSNDSRLEDIVLIRNQSDRCREILKKLTQLSSESDEIYSQMSISQLLEEVIEPHREVGVKINTQADGEGSEPISKRNPVIHYGLGNLIENAVDFARTTVDVIAEWNANNLTIRISDDGPGFSSDIMSKLGEPYLTSRSKTNSSNSKSTGGGLGLGFFIAKTLLERSGGLVTLQNQKGEKTGAQIEIRWPRSALDITYEESMQKAAS